jgi:replication factor A1
MIIGDDSYFSKIQEINSDKSTWNTKAKIIRLWEVSDFNQNTIPFSIEMVLMDADGGRIHATVRKTLIYKFKDDLKEGKVYTFENMGVATNGGAYRTTHHPYKLTFQFTSLIQMLANQNIDRSPYSFTPIADIVGGSYDTDFLVGELFGFCYFNFVISLSQKKKTLSFILRFITLLIIRNYYFQM